MLIFYLWIVFSKKEYYFLNKEVFTIIVKKKMYIKFSKMKNKRYRNHVSTFNQGSIISVYFVKNSLKTYE